MKLKSTIYLFALLSVSACKKDKPVPETIIIEADGLPRPTSSGLNVFGFLLNGNTYWEQNQLDDYFRIAGIKDKSLKHLEIVMAPWDNERNEAKYQVTIGLDTNQLKTEKTLTLGAINESSDFATIVETPPGGPQRYLEAEIPSDFASSSLKISKYDPATQIIAGTFVLKTKSFTITNGRFDVKYQVR